MKSFHCNHCGQLVFFESFACLSCGSVLAYLPDRQLVAALETVTDSSLLYRPAAANSAEYRLCENYRTHNICNWAVSIQDSETRCVSCRLTQSNENLLSADNLPALIRLEAAKRRLIHTLLQLHLPLTDPQNSAAGLNFAFKADAPGEPALTGHAGGLITINIAEADDAIREKRRTELGEPYRTLLGHFRHESGHYYWDRLVARGQVDTFRTLFGDERQDYAAALQQYYEQGAPADWQQRFISAYASSHPWEDWAESWAHYLHMIDVTETATSCGVELRPHRIDEPTLQRTREEFPSADFEVMLQAWFPLTYLLNNLNRSLGLPDPYPFLLATPAIDKLRFVHRLIHASEDA